MTRAGVAHPEGRVPEAGLEPHVVYYPPESTPGKPRWRTLKIAHRAEPLQQQQILAQHDEVNRRIEAIQRKLRDERVDLLKLRSEALDQPVLKPPQVQELGDLRKQNRTVQIALQELARPGAARALGEVMRPVDERHHPVLEGRHPGQ